MRLRLVHGGFDIGVVDSCKRHDWVLRLFLKVYDQLDLAIDCVALPLCSRLLLGSALGACLCDIIDATNMFDMLMITASS